MSVPNMRMEMTPAIDDGLYEIRIFDTERPSITLTFCIREIEWPPEIIEAIAKGSVAGWTP